VGNNDLDKTSYLIGYADGVNFAQKNIINDNKITKRTLSEFDLTCKWDRSFNTNSKLYHYKANCGVKVAETENYIEEEYSFCPYCGRIIEELNNE
jgi:hypothetical protein